MCRWFERAFPRSAAVARVRAAFDGAPIELRGDGAWLALVDREPVDPRPRHDGWVARDLGRPGPWRLVREPDGALVRVFEIPPRPSEWNPMLAAARDAGPEGLGGQLRTASCLFTDALAWAAATHGAADAGKSPAPADEVLRQARELLVERDPVALVPSAGGVALAVPALAASTSNGPGSVVRGHAVRARRAWIDRVAAGARRHWRLVRIGCHAPEPASDPGRGCVVRAEVDLSGLTPALAPLYLPSAVAALRRVTSWSRAAFELLLDSGVASAALDRKPQPTQPISTDSTLR